MTPDLFFDRIVNPTLFMMAASPTIAIPRSKQADVLVTAIAGQESEWKHRRQIGISTYYPQKVGARGYWQFESTWGGPVALNDVMQSTKWQIGMICDSLDIPCDEHALYEACAWNDTLACAMARLLLWIHPAPLPAVGDKEGSYLYYLRQWRPGSPHPELWPSRYDKALAAIEGK